MAKAAVRSHTCEPDPADCPLSDPAVHHRFHECVELSRAFSGDILDFLKRRATADPAHWVQTSWAQATVEAGRVLFQPWCMEILFVLAVSREARFGELQSMLGGISSRTLSDKLQTLREEDLVEREVFDEQPVRITYRLTREGRRTAALATPLFAHLNHRKME